MSMRTKVVIGLLALALVALGAALIAVPFTPRRYCQELGDPAGVTASTAAIGVAGAAALLAIPVGTWGDQAPRTVAIVVALAVATLIGVFGVGFVVNRHVVSYGCG